MVNIQDLLDDARCYETVRSLRWPDGIVCPHCSSASVIKNGRTTPNRTDSVTSAVAVASCSTTHRDELAGHHQPLKTWVACLYLMGLNLSGRQIAKELDINKDDARAIQQSRQGVVNRRLPVTFSGEVECDEVYVVAGHKGDPEAVKKKGGSGADEPRKGIAAVGRSRRRSLQSWDAPMRRRTRIRMSENVKQVTISPLIDQFIVKETLIYTDKYDIDSRLDEWGDGHETVATRRGKARDDDGEGSANSRPHPGGVLVAVAVWLRPHRGIPQETLPLYLGFFESVHNARARGKRPSGSSLDFLPTPPCNPS